MRLAYFCKKGGVGKTTITGEHANYLATRGKRVLIVSVDDQNSIFEMFGCFSEIFARDDNYLENLIINSCTLEDALCEFRPNLYGIKTMNTDMLSKKLTLERPFEKMFIATIAKFDSFDYVFFDLPPSSNRTTEILLDYCEMVLLIVELNKLGVNGFYNTLQYFADCGISFDKIKYILPNGFSKHKSVPNLAYIDLVKMVDENVPTATILPSISEKSCIQAAQHKGVSIFDQDNSGFSSYMRAQKNLTERELRTVFEQIF